MADLKSEETTPNTNPLPTISDRGVDLTQIRRMLKLTPAERLRVGIANSNAAFKLFGRAQRRDSIQPSESQGLVDDGIRDPHSGGA